MAYNPEPNQDYGRMMGPRPRVRRLPMPMQGAQRIPLPMVGREMTMGELPPVRMPRPALGMGGGSPIRSADDAAAMVPDIAAMMGDVRTRRPRGGMMGQVAGPMGMPQSVDMDSLRAALSRIAGGF